MGWSITLRDGLYLSGYRGSMGSYSSTLNHTLKPQHCLESIFTSTMPFPHAQTHARFTRQRIKTQTDCPNQPASNHKQSRNRGLRISPMYFLLCKGLSGYLNTLEIAANATAFNNLQSKLRNCHFCLSLWNYFLIKQQKQIF